MPSNDDMDKLVVLAMQANERTDWAGFAHYCELRGRGLRDLALDALGRFIDEASTWTFDSRLQFARWVLEQSSEVNRPLLLPQPLQARLVIPTLREWSANNPPEAQPHLWLGLLRCDNPSGHLERAIELDPACEVARQTLIQWILGDVAYNQHHLPAFYIHDPRVDLSDLIKAEQLIADSSSRPWAEAVRKELIELRGHADVWLEVHPSDGDFATH